MPKPKFSFTVAQGEEWESPYNFDDSEIRESKTHFDISNFPTPSKIKIKALKEILRKDFFFKRFINTRTSANRVNKTGGFAADMVKPILISATKEFGMRITDGNHTANMLCTLYKDNDEVPVMMYNHTGERAAKAFALWNKEGVKILTQEEVFPAQYMYKDAIAVRTFNVLNQSGRTFNKMPVGDPTFNMVAKNNRVINRGYLERAIKVDINITLDVLEMLKRVYPNDTKDNAILVYALVKGLKRTPVIFSKDGEGMPADLFAEYFEVTAQGNKHNSGRTQDEFLFSKNRVHNKEAESIFANILMEFIEYAKKRGYHDREWFSKLTEDFDAKFGMYYVQRQEPLAA